MRAYLAILAALSMAAIMLGSFAFVLILGG